MTDWKGIVKHGWHPEKEGTSLKGQVVIHIYLDLPLYIC